MINDPVFNFLLFGAKFFTIFFVYGVVSVVLDSQDNDDDDSDGGILQPYYATNR
jgi:hypothetical protein